ncbi:hypothetical protein ACFLIN_07955 [Corynebacterium kutscheri]|uniref:Uncharacterized protein n=1 Tax=Corynebacterium kutscheri TaxID=35755 RepID=A0A0F6TCQ6_9CORY|nr:hypothetical protein [Corynebacterium kutscheri]AKE41054.1 hypothetical protein UL82_04255 [Corynebacterium kutscheri]VEH09353.1 Uncharacterised protein [Corynebacterium kutscheri]
MLTDLEIYRRVDAMIPVEVDRDDAEHELLHCEYEDAIADLLTEAFLSGKLPQNAIDFVSSEYKHGTVAITLEYIAAQMKQSAA